jgi:hypothetical protein
MNQEKKLKLQRHSIERNEFKKRLEGIAMWNDTTLKAQAPFLGQELEALIQGAAKTIRFGFSLDHFAIETPEYDTGEDE